MAKTLTIIDLLQDEEKALLDRLATVRNRIARIKRGELCVDEVVDVPATASTAGDPSAWMKASTATVAR